MVVTADRVIAAGSTHFVVLDYLTGAVLRAIPLRGATTTMLVVDGRAFVTRSGEILCVDVEAGQVLWKKDLQGTGAAAAAIGVPGMTEQGDRFVPTVQGAGRTD
jgi:outer membrane protein assembly factor BamB